jgi:hypothetical protein
MTTPPTEPRPASGPTNGRPWPGSHVRLKLSGRVGIVEEYEYGWNSSLFPVSFCGVSQICSAGAVEILTTPVHALRPTASTPAATQPAAQNIAAANRTHRKAPGTNRQAGVA